MENAQYGCIRCLNQGTGLSLSALAQCSVQLKKNPSNVSAFSCSEIVWGAKAQIHGFPLTLGSPLCRKSAPSFESIGIPQSACQSDAEKEKWHLIFLKSGEQQ